MKYLVFFIIGWFLRGFFVCIKDCLIGLFILYRMDIDCSRLNYNIIYSRIKEVSLLIFVDN